jgi:hypothetical protein
MNFNKLAKESHANAVKHGFWEKRESNEHCLMLVVSVIGEMVEAHRAGKRANLEAYNEPLLGGCAPFTSFIKDTLEDEMADVAIRLGDLAGALGVDFDKMNPCKYHRAFDKFTFTENAFALTKGLCRDIIGIEKRIQFGLEYVTKWAKSINVDLDWHIGEKMKYNATRPPKHGKAINQVQCKCTTKALLMRYIVITENPMTGERTTVETKDFESLRIDQSQIVAIVDKSDLQVTYDGETWCSYEKVYNT